MKSEFCTSHGGRVAVPCDRQRRNSRRASDCGRTECVPPRPGDPSGSGRVAVPCDRQAFSLIEVLVATSLLVIIVIIVGMIFRQSSLSWQSGITRADGNMLVRTVVGAIERDLRSAVDAREYPGCGLDEAMEVSPSSIRFVALLETTNSASTTTREATLVQINGGTEVTRTATRLKYANGTWSAGSSESSILLYSQAGEVQPDLQFEHKANGSKLPLWVNIQVSMTPAAGFRTVSARSWGRDRKAGTSDDIEVR